MESSLGVSVVVLKDENVLLILREDFRVWALPGGGVEAGESTAEAAVREVREETGLDVRLTRLVALTYRTMGPKGDHQALFAAEVVGGEPRPDGVETLKVEWFPLDRLPDRMPGMHRLNIRSAVTGGPTLVRKVNVTSTLTRMMAAMPREELYRMRDQGKLDLQAVLAEVCAPVAESDIQDEFRIASDA